MAAKKNVACIREELRDLDALANEAAPAVGSDWSTPEFWTMAATALTNLVAVAVVLGWISSSDAESVTKALTALIGAGQVIIVNGLMIWKYISARTAVKQSMIDARYKYMAAVSVERIRAEKAGE